MRPVANRPIIKEGFPDAIVPVYEKADRLSDHDDLTQSMRRFTFTGKLPLAAGLKQTLRAQV
jgi:hypothetical protein